MPKLIFVSFSIVLLFSFLVACSNAKDSSETNDKVTIAPINPNGDSELAILMRNMFEESLRVKEQVANNEPVELSIDYEKILTAHATEPEKAASAEYQAFAKGYLQSINRLKEAKPDEVKPIYQSMVQNCMSCHQALCPGPIVKIKKLETTFQNI